MVQHTAKKWKARHSLQPRRRACCPTWEGNGTHLPQPSGPTRSMFCPRPMGVKLSMAVMPVWRGLEMVAMLACVVGRPNIGSMIASEISDPPSMGRRRWSTALPTRSSPTGTGLFWKDVMLATFPSSPFGLWSSSTHRSGVRCHMTVPTAPQSNWAVMPCRVVPCPS